MKFKDIVNKSEWFRKMEQEYYKSNKIPGYISKAPYNYYKNKGWISWGDFLGKKKK